MEQRPHDEPDEPLPEDELVEVEVLDALPVPAAGHELLSTAAVTPALQAAAVAATGFLAGAATLAVLHRRSMRRISAELADLQGLRARYEAARRAPGPFGMVPGQTYLIQIRSVRRPPSE